MLLSFARLGSVGAASLLLLACTSSPDRTDAAVDARFSCTGTLAEVQSSEDPFGGFDCPPNYEAARQLDPTTAPEGASFTSGPCNDLLALDARFGLHGIVCVYDASTRALVGAAAYQDTAAFCRARSTCITSGRLPASVACEDLGLSIGCELVSTGDDAGALADGGDPIDASAE